MQLIYDSSEKAILTADLLAVLFGSFYAGTCMYEPYVWDSPSKKFCIVSALLIIYYSFTSTLTVNAFLPYIYSAEEIELMNMPSENYVFSTCLSIFAAPVVEEIVFRRFMYKTLSKDNATIALIVSSVVFAVWHGTIHHLYAAFFGGLLLCSIYARTGKLRYSIAAHFLFNLAAFFIVFIPLPSIMYSTFAAFVLNGIFVITFVLWYKMDDGVTKKDDKRFAVLTEEQQRRREETRRAVEDVMAEYNNKRH